jgi:outer membrane protein assembly factor BamB
MFRYDLGRSNAFPSSVPATAPTERLRIPITTMVVNQNDDAPSSPVVAGGIIYVDDAVRFHAFDAATGEELWGHDQRFGVGSPAVSDGIVLSCTRAEGLAAYDDDAGEERWRFRPGGTYDPNGPDEFNSSPAIADGTVYVGTGPQGGLYALDLQTGEQQWEFDTHGGTVTPVAVVGDLAIIASTGGQQRGTDVQALSAVYAVERATGTERWHAEMGEAEGILSGPAVVDGVVYVGVSSFALNNGYVLALDAATGEERWRTTVDAPMFAGQIAVGGGHVIVPGGQANTVVALDAATGAERWIFTGGSVPVFGSPAIATDAVVYFDNDRTIRALDLATGELRWEVDTGGASGFLVLGSVWIEAGLIYARAKGAIVVLG